MPLCIPLTCQAVSGNCIKIVVYPYSATIWRSGGYTLATSEKVTAFNNERLAQRMPCSAAKSIEALNYCRSPTKITMTAAFSNQSSRSTNLSTGVITSSTQALHQLGSKHPRRTQEINFVTPDSSAFATGFHECRKLATGIFRYRLFLGAR